MKIAIMNFSGNVGKTTIAAHLLKPRMPKAQIYSVESINAGADSAGLEVEKLKGKKFGSLVDAIMVLDEAIIDVGASNVEDFMKNMQQYEGSHEEFELFIVPVVKEKKVQADSVNTIAALRAIGVPAQKIKVVFNKVETDDDLRDEFPAIFALGEVKGDCAVSPRAAVFANEVFERLKSVGKSLGDLSTDATDYRAKMKSATDEDEKQHAVTMIALQRLAKTANRNLDDVFAELSK